MPGSPSDLSTFGLGVLVPRIIIGALMAGHGAQKLFGWFGGYGLNATGQFMAQLGFTPGRAFAATASITEIIAGVLIVFGFLGPIGPALMLSVMIVAAVTVHWKNGVFAATNGVEVPLLYAVAAVALALIGFGPYSVDTWLGLADRIPAAATWIALAAGAAGAFANLAMRRHAVTPARA